MILLFGLPVLALIFLLCYEEFEFDFGSAFANYLFILGMLGIAFILALNFFILFSQVVLFMNNKEQLIFYCSLKI